MLGFYQWIEQDRFNSEEKREVASDTAADLRSGEDGARILERILNDEVEHVRIGSRWFTYACNQRELDPASTFQEIVGAEFGAIRSSSLNRGARLAAGFSSAELDSLSKSTDNR